MELWLLSQMLKASNFTTSLLKLLLLVGFPYRFCSPRSEMKPYVGCGWRYELSLLIGMFLLAICLSWWELSWALIEFFTETLAVTLGRFCPNFLLPLITKSSTRSCVRSYFGRVSSEKLFSWALVSSRFLTVSCPFLEVFTIGSPDKN